MLQAQPPRSPTTEGSENFASLDRILSAGRDFATYLSELDRTYRKRSSSIPRPEDQRNVQARFWRLMARVDAYSEKESHGPDTRAAFRLALADGPRLETASTSRRGPLLPFRDASARFDPTVARAVGGRRRVFGRSRGGQSCHMLECHGCATEHLARIGHCRAAAAIAMVWSRRADVAVHASRTRRPW
jgi:hypothetical protein